MVKFVTRCAILIAVTTATSGAQTTERSGNLRLVASTPTVTISPIESGRQPVMLPALSLTISVLSACDAGWLPRKLSLSIADIRRTASVSAESESAETTFDIEVPREQLAPVVIEDFCLATESGEPQDTALRLTGYMSAQGALRCSRGEEEKVRYTSRAFDVLVKCAAAETTEDDGDL